MFIFQLRGGLGNQLFQYAAARALSVRRKTSFRVHFHDPDKTVRRAFALHVFRADIQHATAEQLNLYRPLSVVEKIGKLLGNKSHRLPVYEEVGDFVTDTGLSTCPSDAYVSGYWQSPEYFQGLEELICKDLIIKEAPSPQNSAWLDQIRNCCSVAVHVRRGDFITVPRNLEIHGVCPAEYYQRAINLIQLKVEKPVFFFFSEDPEWVHSNLLPICPQSYIIDNNLQVGKEFEDLRLMSECKHQIIANSTFSWWAAWLNRNHEKKIIVPRNWLAIKKISIGSLVPPDWIRQ